MIEETPLGHFRKSLRSPNTQQINRALSKRRQSTNLKNSGDSTAILKELVEIM
jgi:hypothetical protein